MPHSTRPPDSTSTVATFSATRAGWMNPGGQRVTPKPRRRFSVTCERAPRTTSEDGECDRPSRKWCSTDQIVLKPNLSASLICSNASL